MDQQAGPMAELERAQQAHVAFETTSRRVTSVQERKQEVYDEAVIVFEATLYTSWKKDDWRSKGQAVERR